MSEFPKQIDCKGTQIELRLMTGDDAEAITAFAKKLPVHDLLFLGRDIQHAKVMNAWADAVANGEMVSLIAVRDGEVVGTSAIVRDHFGWSPHVAELRLLIDETMRGKGLGRKLLEASFKLAIDGGAEKLIARMTPDQTGAIIMFEDLGFRGEALLKDHVRDRDGEPHDLAIFSLEVARALAQQRAYGFT